ncbi:LysR substrate-binding domain-containing protein [Bosea sp. 124]|uniref:LysR substrate-binding domain-containing protein n=1 Tax=Bosea sp. 124 TaxID=2135642 RepID=UPI000D3C7195|nr:LysR substrate-binding domain-containing protein [Bosea sp. 124]PTM39875.1 DNA-binding transcriptional LysR family regulator [Bosea sp. 124]
MRSFDPVSLRLFIAVCEERNIAAAARREAIVPSAVSKRISQMEDEAGVALLERGRRGVALTPAGETLCRYARDMLHLLDRMRAELGAFAEGVQGHVRVFGSKSAVAQFLPQDIGVFAQRYREVRVSLEEREIWEVVRGVEEGRADIGVCWDAVDLRGLDALPYHRDRLAVIVHPDHPLAGLDQLAFEDTLDYEHVDIVGRSIMTTTQRNAAATAGKPLRHRIQVSTVDAACRIVAAQLALAIVPREEAGAIQEALGLRIVPLRNGWAKRQFVIATRSAGLSLPAQLLVQSLRDSALAVPDGAPVP